MPCLLPTDDLRQRTCGGARETPSVFGLSSWLNFGLSRHRFVPDC